MRIRARSFRAWVSRDSTGLTRGAIPTKGPTGMKFFSIRPNIDEIREAASLGVLDGVTTNPSLMAKEDGDDYSAVLKEICDIVARSRERRGGGGRKRAR